MAEQAASSEQCLVVGNDVELIGIEVGAKWATDLHGADRSSGERAAAVVLDQFAKWNTEWHFENAAVLDVARKLEHLRTA